MSIWNGQQAQILTSKSCAAAESGIDTAHRVALQATVIVKPVR